MSADTLTESIGSLLRAAEVARTYGHAWAKELAHWLDAASADAEQVGADYHAVNFARAWIEAHPAPEMSPAERATWERFEAARPAHPDFQALQSAGTLRPRLAEQYAALDVTFRAERFEAVTGEET